MQSQRKQDVSVKHYAPITTKSEKIFLNMKVKYQCHKVTDLGVIWKSIISGVWMQNMNYTSVTVPKNVAKVEVDNTQINK